MPQIYQSKFFKPHLGVGIEDIYLIFLDGEGRGQLNQVYLWLPGHTHLFTNQIKNCKNVVIKTL